MSDKKRLGETETAEFKEKPNESLEFHV